jgi:lactoylglutathione lyase
VRDLEHARAHLEAAGISLSGGPVTFGDGSRGMFVRDPDRNVVELNQAAPKAR